MKRRLLVMLGLLTVFWVVARQMRKRLFSETDVAPNSETAGSASIAQMVRAEPLQPSPPPAAGATAAPSEAEAVTPPHGDPLEQELAEGTADGARTEAAEERVEGQAGAADGSRQGGAGAQTS